MEESAPTSLEPSSTTSEKIPQPWRCSSTYLLLSPRREKGTRTHQKTKPSVTCHLIPTCWKCRLRQQVSGMEIQYWTPDRVEVLQWQLYWWPPNQSHISSTSQHHNMMQFIPFLPPIPFPHWPKGKLIFVDTWHHDRAASHVTTKSLSCRERVLWWSHEMPLLPATLTNLGDLGRAGRLRCSWKRSQQFLIVFVPRWVYKLSLRTNIVNA